ncbi:MAG: HAD-IB family hydrolase [Bacteroidota bacterium]|nr:HAD-IB family hydrolase [Bacteroidota bacterium]
MKTLALFDFDGTITTKDTFPLFFKFAFGPSRFYLGFSLFLPYFILHKLSLFDGEAFKIKLLSFYLKGKQKQWIEKVGSDFINQLHAKNIIKTDFLSKINTFKAAGADVVVVSASPDAWVKAFCEKHGVQFLCTQLAYNNDVYTGKLIGNNCNGPEKKNRILKAFDLSSYSHIIVFGDSKVGDKEMMELATEKNWV